MWWRVCPDAPRPDPGFQFTTVTVAAPLRRIWQLGGSARVLKDLGRGETVGWGDLTAISSLEIGGKWGRGEIVRTWLCERFEFLSRSGILGSAIKNLFHPWSLSAFSGLHTSGQERRHGPRLSGRCCLSGESVRRRSPSPYAGPLHAVLWAGPSPKSTASMCECVRAQRSFITRIRRGCVCTREIKRSSRQSPDPVGLFSSFIIG